MSLRVDVATGETTLYEVDLRLPGYIPLELARVYRSGRDAAGPLGPGWHASFDISLELARDRIVFRGASGREVVFAPVGVGIQATHTETGLILQHHPNAYVVFFSPLLQQVFPKQGAAGNLLRIGKIEDLNGNALQFGYSGGRLVRLVDTMGRQVHFTYAGDRLTALQVATADGMAPVRAFRYDGQGDLVSGRDALGREVRYAYQDHLMVAAVNRLGATYYAQYDEKRRCTALWRNDGSEVRRFAYDETRLTTLVQATDGLQSLYRYGPGAKVLSRIGASGALQQYLYDEQQRLIGFTDEADTLATIQRLDPAKHTFLLGRGKERLGSLQLDERGLAQQVTDGVFGPYTLAYDERGNLVRLTTPSGAAWGFERSRQGAVAQVVSPEGRRLRLQRSADARELVVADELGTRFTERYDGLGRLTERTDALGRRQRWQYDAEGRVTATVIDGGYQAQFAYDAEGNLVGVSDGEGRRATYRYDPFGRLLMQTDASGQQWQFQYDREGRLVAAGGPGRSLQFHYEEGRLVRTTPPAAEAALSGPARNGTAQTLGLSGELLVAGRGDDPVFFTYRADGLIATLQHAGRQFTFSYDGDGNLTEVQEAEASLVRLQYDRRGRLVEAVRPAAASCRLTYDAGDRLQTLHAAGAQMHFTYDTLDRLVERRALEPDGRPRGHHRFHPTAPEDPVVDPLPGASGAAGGDGLVEPWGTLIQHRHGLVLTVRLGSLQVPVWVQDDALHRGASGLAARLMHACVNGPDAALRDRHRLGAQALLQLPQDRDGLRWLLTEVPRARDLGGPAALLDLFFLRRTFYDYHFPGNAPLYLPHHQADRTRSPDGAVTGSHMTGTLKPSAWVEPHRAPAERHLPLRREGALPDDLSRLLSSVIP